MEITHERLYRSWWIHQMRVTKMHLKGHTAIWFKNLLDTEKDTWDHFTAVFDAKFLNGENKYVAQQALYDRKQLPGETHEAYIEDVLVKADMLTWSKDQTKQHLSSLVFRNHLNHM